MACGRSRRCIRRKRWSQDSRTATSSRRCIFRATRPCGAPRPRPTCAISKCAIWLAIARICAGNSNGELPMNGIRRGAVIGSNRIPFARSNTAYATASNQDILSFTLQGLVDRYDLPGMKLGEVAAGTVVKHSRDFNLMREGALSTTLSKETPAYDVQQACAVRVSRPRPHRQQDRARANRRGHRGRRGIPRRMRPSA